MSDSSSGRSQVLRSRGTQAPGRRPTRRAGHPPAGQTRSSGHLQSRRPGLPRMTPHRFDEWRSLRGYLTPDERRSADH
jgi:hypothetical protein